MLTLHANGTSIPDDGLLDYGEGWIEFRWPDPLFGWECLQIDLEGFCSMRMPIKSGSGPPELLELRQDCIRLRFDSALAAKLGLDENIEIHFAISPDELRRLRRAFDQLNGIDRE